MYLIIHRMSNLFDIACLIYISVMNSTDQDFTYWQIPEDYDIATAYTGVCLIFFFFYTCKITSLVGLCFRTCVRTIIIWNATYNKRQKKSNPKIIIYRMFSMNNLILFLCRSFIFKTISLFVFFNLFICFTFVKLRSLIV